MYQDLSIKTNSKFLFANLMTIFLSLQRLLRAKPRAKLKRLGRLGRILWGTISYAKRKKNSIQSMTNNSFLNLRKFRLFTFEVAIDFVFFCDISSK